MERDMMQGRPAAVTAFYSRHLERIAGIRTAKQRCAFLDALQTDFAARVRMEPQNRNGLSEAYQSLKQMVWEVTG